MHLYVLDSMNHLQQAKFLNNFLSNFNSTQPNYYHNKDANIPIFNENFTALRFILKDSTEIIVYSSLYEHLLAPMVVEY